MARTIGAVMAAALLVSCGGEATAYKSPAPSPSSAVLEQAVTLPPVQPGVVNFKLTVLSLNAEDGFELRFDIPHADTNLFQFCDPQDNPCVKGKTYGVQFRPMGSGKVRFEFRRQIRYGSNTMRIETFKSGMVDLSTGGEFDATWPAYPAT